MEQFADSGIGQALLRQVIQNARQSVHGDLVCMAHPEQIIVATDISNTTIKSMVMVAEGGVLGNIETSFRPCDWAGILGMTGMNVVWL